jgi:hypothetical protein
MQQACMQLMQGVNLIPKRTWRECLAKEFVVIVCMVAAEPRFML